MGKKNYMYIFVACVVWLVVSGFAFAGGQGEAQGSAGKTQILMWTFPAYKGVYPDTPEYGDWEKKIAAEFMKSHPGVTINVELIPYSESDQKWTTAIASKTTPDLYWNFTGSFFRMANKGLLEPLEGYLTADDKSDILPTALAGASTNGHLWCFPMTINPMVFLVNKDITEKAGAMKYLSEDGRWTYDDLLAWARTIKKNTGIYPLALQLGAAGGIDYSTTQFLTGYGAEIYNKDYTKVELNSPASVKGLEFMKQLVDENLVPPGSTGLVASAHYQAFTSQKIAASTYASIATIGVLATDMENGTIEKPFDIYVMAWPSAPGIDPKINIDPQGIAVLKQDDAAKKAIVIEFAKRLSNKEELQRVTEAVHWVPLRKSVDLQKAYANAGRFKAQLAKGAGFVQKFQRLDIGSSSVAFNEVRKKILETMQSVVLEQMSPQAALDKYMTEANQILAEKL